MALPRSPNLGWRLDQWIASAAEPIFVLTPDRRITLINAAWEKLTGHGQAEVIGLECRSHGPTRAGDLLGLGGSFCPPPEALAGQPVGVRTLIISRGGDRLARRIEFGPLHDHAGQLTGLLGIVRPIASPPPNGDAESQSLRFALLELRARMFARHAHDTLTGQGPAHQRVLDGIDAAVGSSIPVAIVGEPGTGKRFVARLIHQLSARRQQPLLGYDCRALPSELIERELFGDSSANFRAFDGSSLVLSEFLALPRDLQSRLITALDRTPRTVRVIGTSSLRLDRALALEQIRLDFYETFNTLQIALRPLRDRLDELPLIAQSLLERMNLRGQGNRSGFHPKTIDVLLAHDWPGNIRELAKVIEDAHQAAQGDLIAVHDLPAEILGHRGGAYTAPVAMTPPLLMKDRLLAYEQQLIEEALQQERHNKTRAARRLGVNRPFLYRRMKELGILDLEVPPGRTSERNSIIERSADGREHPPSDPS